MLFRCFYYPWLAVLGGLGSDSVKLCWLLLLMILNLLLVTGLHVSIWSLSSVLLGCSRYPGESVDLAVTGFLGDLKTVALVAADVLGALQTI